MAKSFKDKMQQKAVNPALMFISQQEPEKEPPTAERKIERQTAPRSAPPARRALPQYDEETKSRRLQLLLTPSLYEAVKAKAAQERMSVNEYINSVLKDATGK